MELRRFTLLISISIICSGIAAGAQPKSIPKPVEAVPDKTLPAPPKPNANASLSRQGPLANLPSDPGAQIEKIRALENDSWLSLGAPQGDPKWGRARGRAWGGRALVSAPELRGAFYFGEGQHAFVKPDGHIMDDIWFYDINAHRWIAVYPGTDTATFSDRVKKGELKIDDNGQLVDNNARPVPVHTLGHAWNFLTYDMHARKFAFLAERGFGRFFMGNEAMMDEGLKILETRLAGNPKPPMSPWFYDTVSGEFERYPVVTPRPDVGGFPNFQYAKHRKQFFYGGAEGVAFFDSAARKWIKIKDTGPRPIGYDHGGAYDEKRDRIYMGAGKEDPTGPFHVYDIESNTWSKPNQVGAPAKGFRTNDASIFYDVKNDVVTVFQYREKKIFTYSPDTDTWSSREFPAIVFFAPKYPSFSAFYDAELNAAFLYIASDSTDNGIMWAYRYKK